MYRSQLGSFRQRLEVARQSDDLYFASLLDRKAIAAAFGEASGILDAARISTTAVTLWVFLSQVLSTDHGCVSAVARLIHYLCARGLSAALRVGADVGFGIQPLKQVPGALNL